MMLPGRKFGL